ncbi:MAG: RidA family protein [Candidatus Kapaibacterium sp.]|nr:MAG: RidA family protein [Candidatus Kapabacteria bacterium]
MKPKIFILFFLIIGLAFGCSFRKFNKEIIYTENSPKPIGPYSQAVKVGKFVFVSGQIGINPADGTIPQDVEQQFHQVMKNIENILKEAGTDLSQVVKVTIYLKDLSDFAKINSLYSQYFVDKFPARETVEVSGLPRDAKIEISVIAITKKR